MKEIELLQSIHETAEMGILGLENVEPQVRDGELRRALDQQTAEYRKISDSARQMLREKDAEPKGPGVLAKLSSEVMSTMKTLADPSPSNIAEMVIQGNTMGITKGTRNLNDFTGEDRDARALAEKLLHTEQANVEQMKTFL